MSDTLPGAVATPANAFATQRLVTLEAFRNAGFIENFGNDDGGDGALVSSSVVKNTGPLAEAFLLCCGVRTSTQSTPSGTTE